jgi:hypothetical protein
MEQTAKQAAEWFAKFGTMRKRSEVTADHALRRNVTMTSQIIVRSAIFCIQERPWERGCCVQYIPPKQRDRLGSHTHSKNSIYKVNRN